MKNKTRIYVEVSGGVVTTVKCTVPADVVIIDHDGEGEDSEIDAFNKNQSSESKKAKECCYVQP